MFSVSAKFLAYRRHLGNLVGCSGALSYYHWQQSCHLEGVSFVDSLFWKLPSVKGQPSWTRTSGFTCAPEAGDRPQWGYLLSGELCCKCWANGPPAGLSHVVAQGLFPTLGWWAKPGAQKWAAVGSRLLNISCKAKEMLQSSPPPPPTSIWLLFEVAFYIPSSSPFL